jgi:hypothetical protein
MWRIKVADYDELAELIRIAREDHHGYLADYHALEPLRAILNAEDNDGNLLPIEAAGGATVRQALVAYGALGHWQQGFYLADAAAIANVLSEESVRAAFCVLRDLSRHSALRVNDHGGKCAVYEGFDANEANALVDDSIWSALRDGRRICLHGGALLYPTKVALLLSGAVVALDSHVRTALGQLGFDGLQHPWLHGDHWAREVVPVVAAFQKVVALAYIAGDLWHRDDAYRTAVEQSLPLAYGDPGRVLDILLLTASQSGIPASRAFRAVHLGHGAWYS